MRGISPVVSSINLSWYRVRGIALSSVRRPIVGKRRRGMQPGVRIPECLQERSDDEHRSKGGAALEQNQQHLPDTAIPVCEPVLQNPLCVP